MNPTDGSGNGNGAPPPGATPPASPQAQGDAPASSGFDPTTLAASIAEQVRNSVNADLRRAGVFDAVKQLKQKGSDASTPTTEPAQPAASPSHADMEAMVRRQSAFDRAIGAAGLSDEQIGYVDKLFQLERPEDPGAWVQTTVKTLGIGRSQAVTPTPPAQPSRFVSNGGAPSAPSGPSYADEPWKMPQSEVDRLIAEKGHIAAGYELRERVRRALTNTRVLLPRR